MHNTNIFKDGRIWIGFVKLRKRIRYSIVVKVMNINGCITGEKFLKWLIGVLYSQGSIELHSQWNYSLFFFFFCVTYNWSIRFHISTCIVCGVWIAQSIQRLATG
jgi:hypothetical protein